jgi:hypothetical protein
VTLVPFLFFPHNPRHAGVQEASARPSNWKSIGTSKQARENRMSPKAQRITGWILTGLVGLFMIGASGVPKIFDFPGKNEMMDKMGMPLSLLPAIAVLEIAVAVIYLIPRTAFLGAILLTGYLGGAVFTHLRIGEPWYFPIIIGVLAWLGLALRQPTIFHLAKNGTTRSRPESV